MGRLKNWLLEHYSELDELTEGPRDRAYYGTDYPPPAGPRPQPTGVSLVITRHHELTPKADNDPEVF